MDDEIVAELRTKSNGQFHIRSVGCHLVLTNTAFDAQIHEQPHHSLTILLNLDNHEYRCRSWGREVERGSFSSCDLLVKFCTTVFGQTGCIGIGDPDQDFPFSCQFSPKCSKFAMGSPRCRACEVARVGRIQVKDESGSSGLPVGVEAKEEEDGDDDEAAISIPMDLQLDEFKQSSDGEDEEDVKPSDILELLVDTNVGEEITNVFGQDTPPKRSYVKKEKVGPKLSKKRLPKTLNSFACNICGVQFNSSKSNWRHKVLEHGKGKFKCHVCDESATFAADFVTHIREAHPGTNLAYCPKCSELIQFDSDLDTFPSHFLACARKCRMGSEAKQEAMKRRFLKNQVPCTCDECGKTYTNLNNLRTHQKIHKGLGQVCKDCGFVSPHRSMLALHMERHRRERGELDTMLCSVCGDPFEGKLSLTHHMARKHKEYPCDDCGEKIIGKDNLKIHRATVHLINKCSVCNVGFPSSYILKRHMEVHIEPMIKCRFCDRMFKRQDGVVNHERTHTGETPFSCNMCPYVCKSSATLSLHKKFKHNRGKNLKKASSSTTPIEK